MRRRCTWSQAHVICLKILIITFSHKKKKAIKIDLKKHEEGFENVHT
jgi:hypothetical protein